MLVMSRMAGRSEAAAEGDRDSHAAGSLSSEAPRSRAPVVAAMPLDPALVDLIAAKVAAQLKGSAESVRGDSEGERSSIAPDTGGGDSPSEPPNRESGGKEEW